MKTQAKFFTAAAATAIAGLVSAAPAQAISFGNSGILFEEDTTLEFNFLESHGWFQSDFGVIDSDGNTTVLFSEAQRSDGSGPDNQGTCGLTVIECSAEFTFEAGKEYSLFLDSGTDVWQDYDIYSTDSKNASGLGFANQFKFFQGTSVIDNDLNEAYKSYNTSVDSALGQTAGIQDANPFDGNVLIAVEDSRVIDDTENGYYGHADYNDFLVTAKVAVPEPATIAGLGLVAGAMAVSRRRKTKQNS
jgi:hypothetical protein